MFKGFFHFFILVCLCTGMVQKAGAQQSAQGTTTIVVMRHAEKESGKDPDPELSPEGKKRAAQLAYLFKDMPVTRLLATPFKRTQHTLANLSSDKGVMIESYEPSKITDLVNNLKQLSGETIVIAGHANTAPDLVNQLLNEKKYNQLSENEFGKIWIVTLDSGKALSCILLNTN
jgi:2,3-bisphosphoglycerate-dependent phosphoglycerate mutase